MKLRLTLYFAPLTLLLICSVSSVATARCVNDLTYIIEGNTQPACTWIRESEDIRQELCLEGEVRMKCPITCGLCCVNDPRYAIKLGKGRTEKCSWLDTLTNKGKKRRCGEFSKNQPVKDGCPLACGNCATEVIEKTLSPTRVTDTPTVVVIIQYSVRSQLHSTSCVDRIGIMIYYYDSYF